MIKHANFQHYRVHPDRVIIRNLTIDGKFINKRVRLFIHQTMSLKRVEKEKILGRHNKVAKWLFNYFKKIQKQLPEMFYKKVV